MLQLEIQEYSRISAIVFFVLQRKRNAKGTPKERTLNLKNIEWKTGGKADVSAQQAGVSGAAENKYWRNKKMYFDKIAKIIAERTGCDVASVKPESKFVDLGIDSLDTVELLMSLEDEIGMEIELDQKVETVDDLDKFIQSKTA